MAKILIVDGGVPFHGKGGTLNHSYAELAQKTLTAMGHEAQITRVDAEWVAQDEAEKFKAADVVMLNFAAWWMSVPWQVKRYIDEVFCSGLAAGGDGRTHTDPSHNYGRGGILTDKKYMLAVTWNAPLNAFVDEKEFFGGVGIETVLLPVHKAFQFIGMSCLGKTFMANDVIKNPTHELDFKRFEETIKENFAAL